MIYSHHQQYLLELNLSIYKYDNVIIINIIIYTNLNNNIGGKHITLSLDRADFSGSIKTYLDMKKVFFISGSK